MNQADFAAILTQRGGVGTDKVFCGTYQGVPFTSAFLSGKAGGKTTFLLSMQFGQKVPGKMVREIINGLKGRAKVTRYVNMSSIATGAAIGGAVGGAIMASQAQKVTGTIQFNGQDPTHLLLSCIVNQDDQVAGVFDDLMGAALGAMRAYNLTVPDACPLCKTLGCDSYAFVNGSFRPVHDACVRNMAVSKHAEAEHNQRNGNYVTGILGAILGAVVGMLPSILLLIFFNRFMVWLFALIPLCAYYGYKLLGGKMNKGAFWIVSAISVVLAPFTELIALFILLLQQGYVITAADVGVLMREPGFLYDMFIALLFVLLGILIVSGITRRTNAHVMQDAALSAGTLRPMGQ